MKFISFFLIFTLLLSFLPAYSVDILRDIDEHWAEDYIQSLFDMGIVKGSYSKFNPESSITRGEFIALISRSIFNLTNYTPIYYFEDVKSGHMFFSEVSLAKDKGLIIGKQSAYLGVNDNITREEAVIIISRLFDYHKNYNSFSFLDIPKNYPYKNELNKVVDLGIIEGNLNGKFEPKSNLKRSESAKIIVKVLEEYGEKEDETKVLNAAKEYFENPNSDIAIGREKDELIYKSGYIDFAKSIGVSVDKTVSDENFEIYNITSNTAHIKAEYDVKFITTYADKNQKEKNYRAKNDIYLLKKDGKWSVYLTNENFFIKEKVNLTWEVFINPPTSAMDGVNVVSPVWYELTIDNSNASPVHSESELNLYLTDKSTKKYVDFAKNNGYDLWIVYRNDFNKENTEKFLKNDISRKKALNLVIESVLKNKAEGINLDFENMTDKYDYLRHVKEVTLASHALGLITSVDITKYDKYAYSWSMCFDRDYIANICDYVILMAYDEYGTHSKTSGSVASLSWTEESIKTTLKEVEREKLILGVPFYVRYWQEKDGKVVKTSAISMERANEIIQENGAEKYIQDGQYVAKWKKDGYDFSIYLENAFSIENRVALVRKYNLCGVASWRRGFETDDIFGVIKSALK